MSRPTGIKENKPRKRKVIVPGRASWQRYWIGGHYKSKGLSFEMYQQIASQPCHYCGDAPRYCNAYGNTYDEYLNHHTNSRPSSEGWWQDQWIYANGVDKMTHQEDYLDLSNLVPCCTTCNFMKRRMGHDAFIAQCQKIAKHFAK